MYERTIAHLQTLQTTSKNNVDDFVVGVCRMEKEIFALPLMFNWFKDGIFQSKGLIDLRRLVLISNFCRLVRFEISSDITLMRFLDNLSSLTEGQVLWIPIWLVDYLINLIIPNLQIFLTIRAMLPICWRKDILLVVLRSSVRKNRMIIYNGI